MEEILEEDIQIQEDEQKKLNKWRKDDHNNYLRSISGMEYGKHINDQMHNYIEYALFNAKQALDSNGKNMEAESHRARTALRNIFQDILKWEPMDVRQHLNDYVIDTFKLRNLIDIMMYRYNSTQRNSPAYICNLLYGIPIRDNERLDVRSKLNRIMYGNSQEKWSKDEFSLTDKYNVFAIIVNERIKVGSLEDLYKEFAKKDKIMQILKDYRLEDIYGTYITPYTIDLLHWYYVQYNARMEKNETMIQLNELLYMKTRYAIIMEDERVRPVVKIEK